MMNSLLQWFVIPSLISQRASFFAVALLTIVFVRIIRYVVRPRQKQYRGTRDKKGRYDGDGVLTYVYGDVYKGEFKRGRPHGYGEYFFKKGGGSYKGTFRNGHYNGRGKETYSDKSIYEGDFVDGKRHGHGAMTYVTGASYNGGWQDGKKHGTGCYKHVDGSQCDVLYDKGVRTDRPKVS